LQHQNNDLNWQDTAKNFIMIKIYKGTIFILSLPFWAS